MDNFMTGVFVSLVGASLVGLILSQLRLWRRQMRFGERGEQAKASYQERVTTLSESLIQASRQVDSLMQEMELVAKERQAALKNVETKLEELGGKEKELQEKVGALEKVSYPAVEYFLEATEKAERRSAKRDYMLFMAGVITSTIITVILKLIFGI